LSPFSHTGILLGYKLRKHIAKALKARSQAIRTSLDQYNAAANAMTPCRPTLTWDNVVEYAFLADFDLLRDSRQDIRERPWTKPACRVAMDQYFKQLRAQEEITRLNVEIPRVITFMQDETAFLLRKEKETALTDPILAYQISSYRNERGRFYDLHMRRFAKLASIPGFTGSLKPGVSINTSRHTAPDPDAMPMDNVQPIGVEDSSEATGDDDADDVADDEDDEVRRLALRFNVLCVVNA
jgi:hypothetical protein